MNIFLAHFGLIIIAFYNIEDNILDTLSDKYFMLTLDTRLFSIILVTTVKRQRTLTVGGRITVKRVSSFTSLDSTGSLHTKTTYFLCRSSPVLLGKLETSFTVILPPTVSVLFNRVHIRLAATSPRRSTLFLELSGIGDDDVGSRVTVLRAVLGRQRLDQLERRLVEDATKDDVLTVELGPIL